MRITRILLVLVFLVVAALSAIQGMTGRFSSADDPPSITCPDEIPDISVKDGRDALLTGITAADPQDGDISERVLVTGVSRLLADNTAKVSYAVFDSDHNMATLTRYIRYTDYRLPRFSLEEPLNYSMGQTLRLLDQLKAYDVIDGDITDAIRVTYADMGDEPGIHSIEVQVTNSMGDSAWLTLPVILRENDEQRLKVTLDTYLVYLEQGSRFSADDYIIGAAFDGDPVNRENFTITGEVDTHTPGTYQVEYTCRYGSHSGTAILTVVVE